MQSLRDFPFSNYKFRFVIGPEVLRRDIFCFARGESLILYGLKMKREI